MQSLQRLMLPSHLRYFNNSSLFWPAVDVVNAQQRHPQMLGHDSRSSQRFVSTTAAPETFPILTRFWEAISNSTPVAYVQQALIEIHDATGLPWWATIMFSSVLFRSLVTLPLAIYQHRITARIEQISLEMPALVAELKREAAIAMKQFKWTETQTRITYNRSLRKQWKKLIVRDNCHPAKTIILLWGQIPLWICQSVALRNLVNMLPDPSSIQSQIIFTELTLGGFGWIPNLTEVDSSYILPVTFGALNLAIIEVQGMLRTRPASRFQNIATNLFRVVTVAMVPVACSVPSALCVYWVSSSSYGLFQNLFLLSPKVRRAVGIVQTKSELQNPYEVLWTKIKLRTKQIDAKSAAVVLESKSSNSISFDETRRKN